METKPLMELIQRINSVGVKGLTQMVNCMRSSGEVGHWGLPISAGIEDAPQCEDVGEMFELGIKPV